MNSPIWLLFNPYIHTTIPPYIPFHVLPEHRTSDTQPRKRPALLPSRPSPPRNIYFPTVVASIGVVLILANALLSTVHPSVVAPAPVKNAELVVFPLNVHCSHLTTATPNLPALVSAYVAKWPTGRLPFQAGTAAGIIL